MLTEAQRETLAAGAAAQPQVVADRAPSRLIAALTPTLLPNHYAPLHGLRVGAIILVVQLHATAGLQRIGVISFSTDSLWFGMDLFFFLSGFLIGSMLLAETRSGQPVDMLRFYMRRSFRIVPAYLIVLTLLVLIGDYPPETRANLWLEYLYLTNYASPVPGSVVMPWAWSLAVEEHFYIVVPVLVSALRWLRSRRAQLGMLFLLWLSALLVRGATFAAGGPWDIPRMMTVFYVQSHLRYDILVAGIFAACVQHYYGEELARRFRQGRARHVAIGTSVLFFALILGTQSLAGPHPAYALVLWGTYTSLAYLPLVLWLLNHESALSRLLSRRVFLYIATFGYGIYLIHVIVIWVVVFPVGAAIALWAQWTPLTVWMFVVCATLVVSTFGGYLVHVLIEKPSLLLRDRLSP